MNTRVQLPGLKQYPDIYAQAQNELASAGCCGSRQAIIRKYVKMSQEKQQHRDLISKSVPSNERRRHKLI